MIAFFGGGGGVGATTGLGFGFGMSILGNSNLGAAALSVFLEGAGGASDGKEYSIFLGGPFLAGGAFLAGGGVAFGFGALAVGRLFATLGASSLGRFGIFRDWMPGTTLLVFAGEDDPGRFLGGSGVFCLLAFAVAAAVASAGGRREPAP